MNPLQWTSRHLDLVGSRFEDVDIAPAYTVSVQTDKGNDLEESCLKRAKDAELIAESLSPITKRHHLIKILVGEDRAFAYHR